MSGYGSVVHDPAATLDEAAPHDRTVHEQLVETVLIWRRDDGTVPPPADIDQVALQLTSYARLLLNEVKGACGKLPSSAPAARLGRCACGEAVRRLGTRRRPDRSLEHAQSLALLVRALHRALDRAETARRTAATTAP